MLPLLYPEETQAVMRNCPLYPEKAQAVIRRCHVSGEGSSSELSGFSRNPSEERLAQGGYSEALTPSGFEPYFNVPS